MFRGIAIGSLLIAATTLPIVHADSYRPFRNFRQVDATGRYYIVVKKNGGRKDPGAGTPVTFEIAERKHGSPPVTAAEDGGSDDEIASNPEVSVRPGDPLLGKGSLKRCFRNIVISSTGLGFVGLDVRGHNYGDLQSRDALVVVSMDGTVRHRKALIDLFSEKEVDQFVHSAGSIFWMGGGWIDETRKEIVVVGSREFPDVECLGNEGPKAKAAVPDLIRILETKPKTKDPFWTQQLAALALGRIGRDATAALPGLTHLAETRARDDSEKVKLQHPEQRRNVFGDMNYSDDYFIDAIYKIRQR